MKDLFMPDSSLLGTAFFVSSFFILNSSFVL